METTKVKKVIYDSQGMAKAAAEHFDWLLVLDEALVQKFFIAMAVEQEDGSLLLPESIRSKVAVEVIYVDAKPVPPFDSSTDESPSAFERVVEAMPALDFEAERTEVKAAAIDRIIVGNLSV